jgi:hypothetical protein
VRVSLGLLLAGLAAALVATMGAIWFRRAMAVQLPERFAGFGAAMAAGVVLGATALGSHPGWLGGALACLAIAGGALFLATLAISAQKGGSGSFQVGRAVPDFSAPDESGAPVALASFMGSPLLLKFFRGHW